MSNKKYGLILPEKGKLQPPKFQALRNVFGNDSESDEEKPIKRLSLLRPSDNINRQTKITQEKAVVEDPTVYQYDEIYEEMVGAKEKEKKKSKGEVKPRYIENLMKSAQKRKTENERRIERQIQKEREKEGDEFKDKEVFVTSAYKKKLEELREEEEKEKREEYLESIGDVTKQRDLGGFYRHIYEQKLGSEKPVDSNKTNSEDTKKDIPQNKTEKEDTTLDTTKKRNYRKRKLTETKNNLSDGEIEDSDEEINRMNLENIKLAKKNKQTEENIDADSDFSIDESSDDESQKNSKLQVKQEEEVKETGTPNTSETPERPAKSQKDSNKENTPVPVEVKPKIDIWKKRTVGEVLNQALKRYYERKASRGY